MNVKPCPPECALDWVSFHKQLDWAIAHMIEELSEPVPGKTYLPSQQPIGDLMQFSHLKSEAQKDSNNNT